MPPLLDDFSVGGGRHLAAALAARLPLAASRAWWEEEEGAREAAAACPLSTLALLRAVCALAARLETPFSDFDDDAAALGLVPPVVAVLSAMAEWNPPAGLAAPKDAAGAPTSAAPPPAVDTRGAELELVRPLPHHTPLLVLCPHLAAVTGAAPGAALLPAARLPEAGWRGGRAGRRAAALQAGREAQTTYSLAHSLTRTHTLTLNTHAHLASSMQRSSCQSWGVELQWAVAHPCPATPYPRQPFIREWALLAVRNLTEGCAENQATIAGLKQLSTPTLRVPPGEG